MTKIKTFYKIKNNLFINKKNLLINKKREKLKKEVENFINYHLLPFPNLIILILFLNSLLDYLIQLSLENQMKIVKLI